MTDTIKLLVRQSVFYNASVLVFQWFITFYIIKYFHGVQWAIMGNMILYISLACWYLAVSWANHQKSISVKHRFFFSMVICLLATSLMQWKTLWLLMVGNALLGFGKGIYFCSFYLYEFAYVDKPVRVRYAGLQNAWKAAIEIAVPFILWYFFSIANLPETVYLGIFLLSGLTFLLTALTINKLPDMILPPTHHTHYKQILSQTSSSHLLYLWLIGINVMLPFIATLLEVHILHSEAWMWVFQSVTKLVTLLLLLLILHYFHATNGVRQLMYVSVLLGVVLFLTPWWSWWLILIIYALAKSFLLPLFTTYEKSVGMHIMEQMAVVWHSMLPVIIIQTVLYAIIRGILFGIAYVYTTIWSLYNLIVLLLVITGVWFIILWFLAKKLYKEPDQE